jgi:hypothetical protein
MPIFARAYLDAETDRLLRPDAYRWLRPDWRRHVQRGSNLERLYERIERKYRPDQARVPAGTPDGGQWTDEVGSGGGRGGPSSSQGEPSAGSGRSDPRVLSDATPDNYYKPGTRLAQATTDGSQAVDPSSVYDKVDAALLPPRGVDATGSVQKLQYRLDDSGRYLGGVTVVNEDHTAIGRMINAVNGTPVRVGFEADIQTADGNWTRSFEINKDLSPGSSVTVPWKEFGPMQGPRTITIMVTNRGSLYTGVYVGARRVPDAPASP